MSDITKKEMAAPAAKPLNLTDLCRDIDRWNMELQHHTGIRNFMFRVANGEAIPPVFMFNDEKMPADGKPYTVDLAKMPDEVVSLMLVTLIEHEEKLVFDSWEQIARVGQQALEVIKHVKEQRAKPPTDELDEVGKYDSPA